MQELKAFTMLRTALDTSGWEAFAQALRNLPDWERLTILAVAWQAAHPADRCWLRQWLATVDGQRIEDLP